MNVLLIEKSEYLSDISRKYNVEISKIISANSHLSNFQTIDSGELLAMPQSEITESDAFYQLEKAEFHSLVNHNRFVKRKRQTEAIT